MCGRYTRFAATELIYRYFGIKPPRPEPPTAELAPSWNVAPQTMQPVVRLNPDTGEREMVLMRWGLVPFFAVSPVFSYSTINARAETLLTKPVFREAFRRRRCLIPVNSYYEWQVNDPKKKTRQTWAIGLKTEEPFALGGIWDRWVSPDKQVELHSYSIITVEPNELLAPMHDRMPLMIAPRDYERWLEPGDPQRPPVDLLRPFDAELMKTWPVKPDVGNVRNNRPDLIDPIDPINPGDPVDPDDSPRLF
ncbi:MAG: SOS response-associated peptidase [Terracidiphilus sp.]|jgi:putative SOS response-associated peptidase YedK